MGPDFPSLSSDELASAGEALFGARWRAELAAALGVSEGEVTRVEMGICEPPQEWRARLIALAQNYALRALETASNLICVEELRSAPAAIETPRPLFI